MKINESGRSMIEMLGVLAIIGVLSIGGIAGYSKAMTKHKTNKTIDQVTQIVSSTRALFYGHKSYKALDDSTADLIKKAHLFPDELGNGTNSNPFGGSVTLKSAQKNSGDSKNKAFSLTFTGIPDEACIDISTQDWGRGPRSGLVNIKINNSATSDNTVDIGTATQKCTQTDNNSIEWIFY